MIVNRGGCEVVALAVVVRNERIHAAVEPRAYSATKMGAPRVSQLCFHDGDRLSYGLDCRIDPYGL